MARRTTRLGITQVAAILGATETAARKAITRLSYLYPQGEDGLYDARILDVLRALRGQPHRALEPSIDDWLAHYTEEFYAHGPRDKPGAAIRQPDPLPGGTGG